MDLSYYNIFKKYEETKDDNWLLGQLFNVLEKFYEGAYKNSNEEIFEGCILCEIGDVFGRIGDLKSCYKYMNKAEKFANKEPVDVMTIWLRKAQYLIEDGQVEKGSDFLIKVSKWANNYEDGLQWRNLLDVWEKYKYLVEGKIEPSLSSTCKISMKIEDILKIEDENDLVANLSIHVSELCGFGEDMTLLNQYERVVYDVCSLDEEVHSGGFFSYFYSESDYVRRYKQLIKALDTIGATNTIKLLERVEKKFPRGKIPIKLSYRQKILDEMDEKEINFDEFDEVFWEYEENITKLVYNYVMKNTIKFT
ncbi:DMP19 family protein [Terrisporobacter sp.]